MGTSVFAGMTTTVGAAVFLFLGQIVLFEKFATIIVSTCAISFLTSMLFFGAVMHIIGPQAGFGNLIVCERCKGMNPEEQLDAQVEEMEIQLEIRKKMPTNFFEMMQEGEILE